MAAAGRNGPHGEPFIWLLRVGSLIKDTPSNWIRFLPGVRGVWGFKRPITAATFHRDITSVIGRFKNTHPLTPGKKQIKLVASHSLAIGRTGTEKNATNGHIGNNKATATRIAAINVDVMMTATVLTVGARRRCPRTQEHRRGSGVAQEPDKWLTMRTVSAGGCHGPNLLGKSEAGGGVNCVDPETY
jgi:hypothetical protein